ncbi:hypothetical protein [Paracoccus sp. DMF]|uniref:hypothetical protein n=1 Tax=Paracoccus sp. DMF TaxID=400837 RepID=UPI0021E42B6B|nr:hypothetical protein [Paracoccus sp. DMF]MCV2448094.1 hypothetical protein [Paracoccus sp. DMF]
MTRSKAAFSDRALALPDFPSLEFRTALPEGLEWFESPQPVKDFDAAGMFARFERLWLGYRPEDRDQLEISVYCASIPPERVAIAADYGRLLARSWGPRNYGVDGDARDFGEVMTGEDDSGFGRRTRISVWRRGTDLLILRADTTLEDFDAQAPRIAAMVGSLEFQNESVADSIIGGLRQHELRLPSGGSLRYPLPAHWQAFGSDTGSAAPVSAAIWLDKADEGGNSAIGIFGIAVPAGAKAKDAPLRDIATAMSDLLMQNLAPQVQFSRKPMSENRLKGFAPDAVQGLFLDRLDWAEGRKMGARGFFVLGPADLVGYSSLSAYPESAEAMGLAMHSSFVDRLVLDALREQVGQSAE